jgi:hypothetical protein
MQDRDLAEAEELPAQAQVRVRVRIPMAMHMLIVELRVLNQAPRLVTNLVLDQHLERVLLEENHQDLAGNDPTQRLGQLEQARTAIRIPTPTQIPRRIMQLKELGRRHEKRQRGRRKRGKPRKQKRKERRIWRSD